MYKGLGFALLSLSISFNKYPMKNDNLYVFFVTLTVHWSRDTSAGQWYLTRKTNNFKFHNSHIIYVNIIRFASV